MGGQVGLKLAAVLVSALVLGSGYAPLARGQSTDGAPTAPTVADAKAFVDTVEAKMAATDEFYSRIAWVRATNITADTDWLMTRIRAESTLRSVAWSRQAATYIGLDLPKDLRRKLESLRLGVNVPAPSDANAASELATLATRMGSTYALGRITLDGTSVPRTDLESLMATVRDPARLQDIWTRWREIPVATNDAGTTMRDDYVRMMAIANAGAQELGYDDLGAMWRQRYEMPAADFAAETERLWQQVRPLYKALHCHVRARLNKNYGDAVVPLDRPLRADLLGNMWAQSWEGVYDLVAPPASSPVIDLTARLRAAKYDPIRMVRTGEQFFSSLGFAPLPQTFWDRSQITKPVGRDVVCHASAWNLNSADDIRIKMCTKVNADDFQTVHHELGHNYYQRAYQNQPLTLQGGANGGFHEAIGDMVALSITPGYLKRIGLIDRIPDASADMGLLMQQALGKVAFMPFALLMDRWRWQVAAGDVAPGQYNDAWWELRRRYQGIEPPAARPSAKFDPGAKYHIAGNVSYTRYFLAHILQFQFHKAACEMAGWKGPLHRCSIYGETKVGKRFRKMLALGQSQPWPDTLAVFTGTRKMDGAAMLAYFAPLQQWLDQQNSARSCGW